MNAELFDRVVDRLKGLPPARQSAVIGEINSRVRETAVRPPGVEDIPVSALARRLYLLALSAGSEIKKSEAKSGVPTPQYSLIQDRLGKLRTDLGLEGIDDLRDKAIENFCTHKVHSQGIRLRGFYALVALYVWREEAQGRFDPEQHRTLVPISELRLGHDVGCLFGRRLNEDALRHDAEEEGTPFPEILPERPLSPHGKVSYAFYQKQEYAQLAAGIAADYRTTRLAGCGELDGNSHFIVYRARRADPRELMKSFLVIKPLVRDPNDDKESHHPTLHLYQAPRQVGATLRASPGRLLPLESGLLIIAGQRAEPVRRARAGVRDPKVPFRAFEVLHFPWESFEGARLFPGVALTVNDSGEQIVARICARPTILQRNDEGRIGSVPLTGLSADIDLDAKVERDMLAHAQGDVHERFLGVFDDFGSSEELARRIAYLCNNGGTDWEVAPGFRKTDGSHLTKADVLYALSGTFKNLAPGSEGFDAVRDRRIPPLGPL